MKPESTKDVGPVKLHFRHVNISIADMDVPMTVSIKELERALSNLTSDFILVRAKQLDDCLRLTFEKEFPSEGNT